MGKLTLVGVIALAMFANYACGGSPTSPTQNPGTGVVTPPPPPPTPTPTPIPTPLTFTVSGNVRGGTKEVNHPVAEALCQVVSTPGGVQNPNKSRWYL